MYPSKKANTEHYREGEFDAFREGKKVPDIDAVTIRRSAIEGREAQKRRSENEGSS